MPPSLQLQRANPKLELDGFRMGLPSQIGASCRAESAGVSCFGYSGTNAHAVLKAVDESMVGSLDLQLVTVYAQLSFAWWTKRIPAATEPAASSVRVLPDQSKATWERSWPTASCSYIAQHRVGRTPVAPGTGYLCLATRGGFCGQQVVGAQFMAMLVLDGTLPVVVRVSAPEVEAEGLQRSIEASVGHCEWIQHALVTVANSNSPGYQSTTLAGLPIEIPASVLSESALQSIHKSSTQTSYLQIGLLELKRRNYTKHSEARVLWQVDWVDCFEQDEHLEPGPVSSVSHSDSVTLILIQLLKSIKSVQYTGALEVAVSAGDVLSDVLLLVHTALSLTSSFSLTLFTMHAHAAGERHSARTCLGWLQAGVWGLARSVRNEHPDFCFQCLDCTELSERSTPSVKADEPESVLQLGVCYVRRLVASSTVITATATSPTAPRIKYHYNHAVDGSCLAVNAISAVTADHRLDVERLTTCVSAQEALAREYLWKAMQSMRASEVYHEHHRKLWQRWNARLSNSNEGPSHSVTYKEIISEYPEVDSSLAMLARCGPRLAAVLRGHEDPLELLFPGGSMNEAEAVYADSPAAQFYNKLAGAAIEALVEDAVSEQTGLRLLEIGGGTGGTTTSILPLLPSPYSEYWFTDLSDAFLKRARQRWQGPFPFVRYGIFNAELDPVHQGYPARSFDAALAVNVLHATRDLKVTLTNTHRLLRPSGLLVLSEVTETKHTAVADCTWGLTEGWWLFSDGREFAPQSRDQWQQWLNLTGFALASDAMQPRLSECGALEAQTVFAARASVTNPASVATPQASVGSFVVTGGLGGIGLVTGCWLVECHSVSQLMLTSRSGAVKDETDQSTLKRLQHDPCTRVLAVGCDITQLNQVQRLVLECPWLCGLVHSVGVLSDAVIENQQLAAFQKVTSPKADGACHLLKLTQSAPLDCYAVYSSIAGVFGSPGQSPHASANAALDSLVQRLQVCGQAAVGLQWGAWSQIGYAARVGADARANKANAMPSFGPGVGLRALASAWFSLCTVTVTPITSLHKFEFTRSVQHMLKNLPDAGTKARLAGQIDSVDCEIIDGLMGHKSDDQQRAALEEMVARKVHEAAGMKVEATDPLMDSGVDSLAAIELKAGLESELGGVTRLPSTMMFDYPTVRAIAENLHSKLKGWPAALPCASVLAAAQYETQELILAAMACYAPGSCASTTSFAWLLASGNDCLESIPLQRFDADALDGTVLALSAKQGHFLAHPERFDNGHFRISPAEAAAIDPHQRLLLEVGYCAFASRGESRSSLMGSATAVLVGVMTDGEWATCQQRMTMDRPQPMSAFAANGSGPAALAGRLSFVLGLKGPCFSVTTVCSSSLVALDAAAQNLQLGRCTAALVSGVNMIFDPVGFVALGPALAPDGKCKTFDAAANGLGRGDACGSVLLRGAALKKDTVVLKSSGVNNDGRSASMAAPNGPSQVELLQSVNQRASAVGVRRGCLETHGTGTALGDPIEVGALRTVFEHETSQSEPMMLGALKSRLGHTEGAAGVMGVVKAVIMLQHAVSAPNLHFLSANPKVELDGFGIVLPIGDTACNGQASGAEERFSRGVSSFGMSGTNSHAVLVTLNAVAVKPGARLPGVSSAVMYKQSPFAWWAVGDLDASQLDSQWLSNH